MIIGKYYGEIELLRSMKFEYSVELPEPNIRGNYYINGWYYSPEMLEQVKTKTMKTIEEAAKEYSDYEEGEYVFNKGVEFAQQWISIEEELPETDCFVLTKSKGNKDEDYFRVLWFRNFDFFTPEITSNITHWRPIEFK